MHVHFTVKCPKIDRFRTIYVTLNRCENNFGL